MNRRDFLKSLGAVGLFVALPRFVESAELIDTTVPRVADIPVQSFHLAGCIYSLEYSGTRKHPEGGLTIQHMGRARLVRGESAVLSMHLNTVGGAGYWRCPFESPIIYSNDLRFDVDPFVIAHTVVSPMEGNGAMYWGAENVDGKTVETWIPLRKA